MRRSLMFMESISFLSGYRFDHHHQVKMILFWLLMLLTYAAPSSAQTNRTCEINIDTSDVIFILDVSDGISQATFDDYKQFIREFLVKEMLLDPENTRLAFVRFSSTSDTVIDYISQPDSISMADFDSQVNKNPQPGGMNTDTGIVEATKTAKAIFMDRPNTDTLRPMTIIYVTDANFDDTVAPSNITTDDILDELADIGTLMLYGIGVGDNYDENGLKQLVRADTDTCVVMTLAEWKQHLAQIPYFPTGSNGLLSSILLLMFILVNLIIIVMFILVLIYAHRLGPNTSANSSKAVKTLPLPDSASVNNRYESRRAPIETIAANNDDIRGTDPVNVPRRGRLPSPPPGAGRVTEQAGRNPMRPDADKRPLPPRPLEIPVQQSAGQHQSRKRTSQIGKLKANIQIIGQRLNPRADRGSLPPPPAPPLREENNLGQPNSSSTNLATIDESDRTTRTGRRRTPISEYPPDDDISTLHNPLNTSPDDELYGNNLAAKLAMAMNEMNKLDPNENARQVQEKDEDLRDYVNIPKPRGDGGPDESYIHFSGTTPYRYDDSGNDPTEDYVNVHSERPQTYLNMFKDDFKAQVNKAKHRVSSVFRNSPQVELEEPKSPQFLTQATLQEPVPLAH